MPKLLISNPQLALPINVADKASFDNFLVADNNELATALKSSVQTSEPRLVYYYGPASSGKSHLHYASMRLAQQEGVTTSYLSFADKRVTPDLLAMVDVKHLVCLDNIDQWAGINDNERALFTLFEQIKHAGGRLLLSATNPPEQCGFALPDLVSRLASGLVYALQALNEEQQFDAIRMRAKHRGLSISDDTIKYLLNRSSRDSAELFNMLDQIDRASLIEKRKITIPFLQNYLKG